MIEFVNKAAGAGLLALAALPMVSLTVAHAQPVTVKVSDLDLSRPAQVAVLNRRIDAAADRVCTARADVRLMSTRYACRAAVRQEAKEKLAQRPAPLSLASR